MTAAPIWTEFMKKASELPQYADMRGFSQPTGVVDVQLDKATNRLATPACPDDYTSAFVAGTEPHETCDQTAGVAGFFSHLFGGKNAPLPTSRLRQGLRKIPIIPRTLRKRRGYSERSREYLGMTKRRLRCLNQQTVGRPRRIEEFELSGLGTRLRISGTKCRRSEARILKFRRLAKTVPECLP